MCHFITLIVPAQDEAEIAGIMARHGRAAIPIDNPSIRKVLRDGERQFLTTRGHCDCGTILAARHDSPEEFEARLARERVRMKRKGWSDTKIARALDDHPKADARPKGYGSDSLELWNAALHDLRDELGLRYVGLFVRSYSGYIATEVFTASRRDVSKATSWQDGLASLQENEVTLFH